MGMLLTCPIDLEDVLYTPHDCTLHLASAAFNIYTSRFQFKRIGLLSLIHVGI